MRLILGAALFCLSLAANADPSADYQQGVKEYNSGDLSKAMVLLKRAADAGNGDAQAFYGYVLSTASAGSEEDAAAYFTKAAAQNNLEGMYSLASAMAAGQGVKQDTAGAREMFEKAAARGHVPSAQVIAGAYMGGGLGLTEQERASPAAFAAIKRAAEGGDLRSAMMMVKIYQEGLYGVAVSATEAKNWSDTATKISGKKADDKKRRRR